MSFSPKILEIDTNTDVCIIGDIHGCLTELKELIVDSKGWWIDSKGKMRKYRFIKSVYQFVLIGDYLDKGPQICDTIEFIYNNREHFIIVKGNHENFVYNYLKGIRKGGYKADRELIEGWFNSVYVLERFPDLKEKFFSIFENTYDFIYSDKFIVTHAPCKKEYLGKTTKEAIDKQRNLVYPKRREFATDEKYKASKKECFDFLLTEANENDIYHIFGHVMTKDIFFHKNKIGIDTGCVAGGSLSCVCFVSELKTPFFQQHKSYKNGIENIF